MRCRIKIRSVSAKRKRNRRDASDCNSHVGNRSIFQDGPAPRRIPSRLLARFECPPCEYREHIQNTSSQRTPRESARPA